MGLFFDWNTKNSFLSQQMNSSLDHLYAPVEWLLPNTEKLYLLKYELNREVFFAVHVCGHGLAALLVGTSPSYSQQEQSFFVRARNYSFFLFYSFLF